MCLNYVLSSRLQHCSYARTDQIKKIISHSRSHKTKHGNFVGKPLRFTMVSCILRNPQMAVGIQVINSIIIAGIFNQKTLQLIFLVYSCLLCVQILIRCDLSDFLYPQVSTNKKIGKITTQQVRTNQVNEVRCFLLKIPAVIYLLESMT